MPKPAAEQLFNAGGQILEKVLKLENPPFFFRDDRQETLSQQGEYLPLLIGRRRVAPIQCWTGVTLDTPFPVPGIDFINALAQGGLQGLFDAEDAFYEPGIQALCIGPARAIHMIYQDGVPFLRWPGFDSIADTLNNVDSPSATGGIVALVSVSFSQILDVIAGLTQPLFPIISIIINTFLGLAGLTGVGLDPVGYFRVHWGENNQPPISPDLLLPGDGLIADGLRPEFHPDSPITDFPRFPNVCFVHYILKYLGTSANWQAMEYDTEVRPHLSRLVQSSPWFEKTLISDDNLNDLTDDGANPAHVLCQILNAPAPHGLGIPEDFIDFDSLEHLGQICEAEHLPINVLARDGIDAIEQVTQILDEVGIVARQLGRKMQFLAIREPDEADIIDVTPDYLIIPEPDREIDHDDPISSVIVEFNDRDDDYRQKGLPYDDDAIASLGGGPKPVSMELENITDRRTAEKALYRRAAEVLSGGSVDRMVLGRGAREFLPGQPINLDPLGLMRIVSVRPEADSAATHVTARLDNYSIAIPGTLAADDPDNLILPTGNQAPLPDDMFEYIEPPVLWLPENLSIIVMRIPNDAFSRNANALGSPDSVEYTNLGNANRPAYGGTLETTINADEDWFIDSIDIDMEGYTMAGVVDLTGQDDQWRNGVQWVVIGSEIFFGRLATQGTGDIWTITDLIRGRFGTAREAHAINDDVYIFPGSALNLYTHDLMEVDEFWYVKTQPTSRLGGAVDPNDVPAVSHRLLGNHQRPARPGNFHAHTATILEPWHRDQYQTGQAIVFSWSFSTRAGFGQTAGTQDAGAVISDSHIPAEGSWKVEIFNGTVLERTLTSSSPTVTYSNAALVADFGSEPASFTAVLTEVNAGLESDSVTITVEKV